MFRLIVVLFSIAGLISCSDSGTEPDNYVPSRYFPLLQGAYWEYSLLYSASSQASSAGGIMNHREYGYLILSVSEELGNGQFLVRVDFSIDSLKYSYYSDAYGLPLPGDTAYTKYAIYYNSFTCVFKTVKKEDQEYVSYHLTGAEKSLYNWYKGVYQNIDLSLFSLGRYELFTLPMQYQGVQSGRYFYRCWGQPMTQGYEDWHTEANFDLFAGGLVRVLFTSCINCGMISHKNSSISFDLVAFNPGGDA